MAFTPAGPIGNGTDSYQDAVKAYGLPGDLVAPKNLGEEYRWNTPILSYAFDQTFLDYFGSNGVYAVEQAIAILNGVTNVSSFSADLSEFSLDTTRINYQASALGLLDLKSVVLSTMLEELGLADPFRWTWCLRDRRPQPGAQCPNMIYDVIQRNFDPVTFEPSSYVNGVLYTYDISPAACTGGNPLADAREIAVDADGSLNLPVASFSLGLGGYYTGLTRDDFGGLRFLLRPTRIKTEPPAPNSTMIAGGFTNTTAPQTLFTSNLTTLIAQSLTNNAAALQALYPGLVIVDTKTTFFKEVTTNVTAVFTNLPTSPAGSPATLVVQTTLTTNFVFRYQHTFGNVVTNTYYTNTWVATQNVTVTNLVTSPAGTTTLVTNVSPKKFKPVLTSLVSGDYYLRPAGVCDYVIVDAITNVTLVTNILIQINATNTGTTTTNAGGGGVGVGATNIGQQSFTVEQVTWFTNRILAVYPIDCANLNPALRAGIDRIQFQRANYDSLIGRPLAPITNRFTMTVVTNGHSFLQTWERVTAAPDILFTAGDLLEGAVARSAPGFVADPAPPGGALAGPGTITAPFSLTFSKVGVLKQSLGPFTIHQEEAALDFIWASFGEGTNAPILFPSGLSISNLEYMILHPSIP